MPNLAHAPDLKWGRVSPAFIVAAAKKAQEKKVVFNPVLSKIGTNTQMAIVALCMHAVPVAIAFQAPETRPLADDRNTRPRTAQSSNSPAIATAKVKPPSVIEMVVAIPVAPSRVRTCRSQNCLIRPLA
jgi:hypothetical protein